MIIVSIVLAVIGQIFSLLAAVRQKSKGNKDASFAYWTCLIWISAYFFDLINQL